MSTKENNLKEKFKIALTSTAKVIADDFDVKKTNSEEKKIKEFNFLEIDNLSSPNFNWYKSYDKKHKNVKNKKDANICFCTKSQKKKKWKYLRFAS